MNPLEPKRLALVALVLPLTLAVAAPGITESEDSDAAPAKSKLRETAEDVDTLRVLLTKQLRTTTAERLWRRNSAAPKDGDPPVTRLKEPGGEEAESSDPVSALRGLGYAGGLSLYDAYDVGGSAGDATSYTRGFYVPGVGAWIDTTIRVPLVHQPVKRPKGDGDAEDDGAKDDWDQARAELKKVEPSQFVLSAPKIQVTAFQLDTSRIDRALDAAIDLLSKHGHRLRHVPGDESIVIAFKVEALGADPASRYLTLNSSQGFVNMTTRTEPLEQSVIVRVAKKTLDAHAAGDLDAEALRKRIEVTRY